MYSWRRPRGPRLGGGLRWCAHQVRIQEGGGPLPDGKSPPAATLAWVARGGWAGAARPTISLKAIQAIRRKHISREPGSVPLRALPCRPAAAGRAKSLSFGPARRPFDRIHFATDLDGLQNDAGHSGQGWAEPSRAAGGVSWIYGARGGGAGRPLTPRAARPASLDDHFKV